MDRGKYQLVLLQQCMDYGGLGGGHCAVCQPGDLAITRMRWKGRSLVLGLFMVGLMIPVHSTLIPLFSLFLKLHLTDHPLSVILSYIAFNMPITIMILLGFYYALPGKWKKPQ